MPSQENITTVAAEPTVEVLLERLVQWMERNQPGVVLAPAPWRSAFSDIEPRWAQLADLTLELSTRMSVDFMSGADVLDKKRETLTSLEKEIAQFEEDHVSPHSFMRKLVSGSLDDRQKKIDQRAAAFNDHYQQVNDQIEAQLAQVWKLSELSQILFDASGHLLATGPVVAEKGQQLVRNLPSPASRDFEQRAVRRRQENLGFATSTLQQLLPRLAREHRQKTEIAKRLLETQEQTRNDIQRIRARMNAAFDHANRSLAAEQDKSPSSSLAPWRSSGFLGNLVRSRRIADLPASAASALLYIRDNQYHDLSSPKLVEKYRRSLSKATSSQDVMHAKIPVRDDQGSDSFYAMAMLISQLGSPRARLWESSHRRSLAKILIKAMEGVPEDQIYSYGWRSRDLDGVYQAAYELSRDQPEAALLLLSKSQKLLGDEIVNVRHGQETVEMTAAAWARMWIRSNPVLSPQAVGLWSAAASRICIQQMSHGLRNGAVFSNEKTMLAFCSSTPNPSGKLAAATILDATKTQDATRVFAALAQAWDERPLPRSSADDLHAWERVLEIVHAANPSLSLEVAKWLAAPARFDHVVLPSSTGPVFSAFLMAGRLLNDVSLTPAASTTLHHVASHAPSLVSSMMRGRQVKLLSGQVCSYDNHPAQWMQDMPALPSAQSVKSVLPVWTLSGPSNGDMPRQMSALQDLAKDRQDINLATALLSFDRTGAKTHAPMFADPHQKSGSISPRQWAAWLVASDQLTATVEVPSSQDAFVEFLSQAIDDLCMDTTPGSSATQWDALPQLLKRVAEQTSEDPRMTPGKVLHMVSNAMDDGLARAEALPQSAHLSAPQVRSLMKVHALVEKSLTGLDCSFWSGQSHQIAKSWHEVYREKWENQLTAAMGDRLKIRPPEKCEIAFDEVKTHFARKSGRDRNQSGCWAYAPQAIAPDQLPAAIDRTKLCQIVSPDMGIRHGLHVRASMVKNTHKQTLGVDRSVEITPTANTHQLLQQWNAAAAALAAATHDSGPYTVEIEGLAYRHLEAASVLVNAHAVISLLRQGAALGGVPLSLQADLGASAADPWTAGAFIDKVSPRGELGYLPLDMSIQASDRSRLVRHPVFAAAAGGTFSARKDAMPAHVEAFIDRLTEKQNASSKRQKTRIGPPR